MTSTTAPPPLPTSAEADELLLASISTDEGHQDPYRRYEALRRVGPAWRTGLGSVAITGHRDHRYLTVTVDDDGPGIPSHQREEVFRPFLRLDEARNQDEGGTGLGLAIARDIARSHGGDITLGDSPMGGLRATVRIPV